MQEWLIQPFLLSNACEEYIHAQREIATNCMELLFQIQLTDPERRVITASEASNRYENVSTSHEPLALEPKGTEAADFGMALTFWMAVSAFCRTSTITKALEQLSKAPEACGETSSLLASSRPAGTVAVIKTNAKIGRFMAKFVSNKKQISEIDSDKLLSWCGS